MSVTDNMSIKDLILFDLDDTLLHSDTKHFSALVKNKISNYKDKFLFGVNTHRSWNDTKEAYHFYDMNGPIIGEGGSYFKQNATSKICFLDKISKLNQIKVKKVIRSFFVSQHLLRPVFCDKKYLLEDAQTNAIFINQNRIASATIYLSKDLSIYIEEVKSYLDKDIFFRGVYKITTYKNSKLMVTPVGTSKFDALDQLIKIHSYSAVHFISNKEDLPKYFDPHIKIYSVKNGSDDFKKRSYYIAKKSRSFGILEILDLIAGK